MFGDSETVEAASGYLYSLLFISTAHGASVDGRVVISLHVFVSMIISYSSAHNAFLRRGNGEARSTASSKEMSVWLKISDRQLD